MNFATATRAALKSLPISIGATIFAAATMAYLSLPLPFGASWMWLAVLFLWAEFIVAAIIYMLFVHRQQIDDKIERIGDLICYDGLTGAFTRSHSLDQVRRDRDEGCLMIADIDHFKNINDNHGHDVGDRALAIVTKMLQDEVGELGMVGRLGGEEFGIYLPRVNADETKIIGEGLVARAQMTGALEDEPWLYPSISIGATVRQGQEPLGQTLKRADSALYIAKKNGRRRLEFEWPASQSLCAGEVRAQA